MDLTQTTAGGMDSLPRHCSKTVPETGIDTILFRGTTAAVGAFRCPVIHPAFADSGPTERCIVVFPRSSVWIQHDGSRAFVADPNVVTIYNRGQRYAREPLSADGDRCDWFGVSDETARDIVAAFDPGAAESNAGPFRFEFVPVSRALYMKQRLAMKRAANGDADPLEIEEEVVGIVTRVFALAYQRPPEPLARRDSAARRRRALAEHAKAELLRTMTTNRSATDIAEAVGTSAFHLCRVFRAHTGKTMHEYRTDLRLRMALELLADANTGTLSTVAHQLGFASHSHFVRLCQRHFGSAPGVVRSALA